MEEVYDIARKSSYTTHPGAIAAEACAFLGHLLVRALTLPSDAKVDAKAFLDRESAEYYRLSGLSKKTGWMYDQIKQLVQSKPEKQTERCWNWKSESLDIEGTLKARGSSYN